MEEIVGANMKENWKPWVSWELQVSEVRDFMDTSGCLKNSFWRLYKEMYFYLCLKSNLNSGTASILELECCCLDQIK